MAGKMSLGLDIGSEYLKYALLIDASPRPAVVALGCIPITDRPLKIDGKTRHQAVQKALEKMLAEAPQLKQAQRIQLSLSGFMTQTRVLALPTAPPKRQHEILGFEVTSLLPSHSEEDFLYATALLPQTHDGSTRGVVCLTRAEDVNAYLDILRTLTLNPDRVMLGPLSYRHLPALQRTSTRYLTVVIDIGAKFTKVVIQRGRDLIDVRLIPMGTVQALGRMGKGKKLSRKEMEGYLRAWIESPSPCEENLPTPQPERDHQNGEDCLIEELEIELSDFDDDLGIQSIPPTACLTPAYSATAPLPNEAVLNGDTASPEAFPMRNLREEAFTHFDHAFKRLFSEISRTLRNTLRDLDEQEQPPQICIGGRFATHLTIAQLAKEGLGAETVHPLDPLSGLQHSLGQDEGLAPSCAIAIGQALCDLYGNKNELNLIPTRPGLKGLNRSKQLMLTTACLLLIALPLPDLIRDYRLLKTSKTKLAIVAEATRDRGQALEEETRIRIQTATTDGQIRPWLTLVKRQKAMLSIVPTLNDAAKGRIWIGRLKATLPSCGLPQGLSPRRQKSKKSPYPKQGERETPHPSLLAVALDLEAENFQELKNFIRRLKEKRNITALRLLTANTDLEDLKKGNAVTLSTVNTMEKHPGAKPLRAEFVAATLEMEVEL